MKLSENALEIAESRYFSKGENWEGCCRRVGRAVAINENGSGWDEVFAEEIYNMNFLPGGRILRNAGKLKQSVLNCACLPIGDSIEEIGETIKNSLILWSYGAGIGIDFSPLREQGRPLRSKGGESSGMTSFLKAIDGVARTIETGGQRRSGCLAMCRVGHPEIERFISSKLKDKELSYFNLSVALNKDFLQRVEEDKEWDLAFAGQVVKTVKARDLWHFILDSTIKSGDPGLINYDNLVKNNSYYCQSISTTNLCLSGDTLVTTTEGYLPIRGLVGKHAKIWDGDCWIECDNFSLTEKDTKTISIVLQDGSKIKATPEHDFVLEDGRKVKAKNLIVGDKLEISSSPEQHGRKYEKGAYLKGFLTGDGHGKKNREHAQLHLYSTKYCCEDRLLESASELERGDLNTNVVTKLEFAEESGNRKHMRGLVPFKQELYPWVTSNRMRLPTEIFMWDYKSKQAYIAGVLDADGVALDSPVGFGYQISSTYKSWLLDFQILLKSIGVQSKLGIMKASEYKDFNDGYGAYYARDCYRLSISGQQAINLSIRIHFSRLTNLSHKNMKYEIKPKWNKIEEIIENPIREDVYCCTVKTTNKFSIGVGVNVGNCGELPLPAFGMCCLGSLVLPSFLSGKNTNWKKLESTIRNSVRFLDNVLDINYYPIGETERVTKDTRRIGLGVMGLHDYLIVKEARYGSEKSLYEIDKLFKFIRDTAYVASIDLAQEKGAFPKYSKTQYNMASFIRKLPAKLRMYLKEKAIRNCTILSAPPTGTTSLLAEVSSGIEPVFSLACLRKDRVSERMYVHPIAERWMGSGEKKVPEWLVDVSDLSPEDHLDVQVAIQKYIDSAASKTINCPKGTTVETLSDLLLEYIHDLKGVTVYVDGSKEGAPLNRVELIEAKKMVDKIKKEGMKEEDLQSCRGGTCDL